MSTVTMEGIRRAVHQSWAEVTTWLAARPRIFTLPHPEQQIHFELACRLRDSLRALCGDATWDQLYFDCAALSFGPLAIADAVGRRPPIYVDTREIFDASPGERRARDARALAIAVHVLRTAESQLDLDEDGRPRHQAWMPVSMRAQGWLLAENVRQFEDLSRRACEGFVFVVYSNAAGRTSAVDRREVASWASWKVIRENLWWSSRHFRAK